MPADTKSPVLEFDHVSVAYEGTPALADVSFRAYEGESRVIMGATGSGKTVLLKAALGLQRPDSGTVRVFGQDISRMPERRLFEIRSKVGMLFQESALFDSLNIEENVSYPLLYQPSIHCPKEDESRSWAVILHRADPHFPPLPPRAALHPAEQLICRFRAALPGCDLTAR